MKKIIDGHMHITQWVTPEGKSVFDAIRDYQASADIACVDNMCCTSGGDLWGGFEADQSIIGAVAKLENPTVFTHGCLYIPKNPSEVENFKFRDQLDELMEIGLDGIKICDFKPDAYKSLHVGSLLEEYDEYIGYCERYGVHMCWHVGDPSYFWDPDRVSDKVKELGWFYGDGSYPTYEELNSLTYRLLEAHPSLKVTLAHVFFKSYEPSVILGLFKKYPNLCIDLAPGWEMFGGFAAHYDEWRSIFNRYSNRILFGTDALTDAPTGASCKTAEYVRGFLETEDEFEMPTGVMAHGIGLFGEALDNILCKNHERRLGERPREINRAALKRYIDRYLPLMPDTKNRQMTEEYRRKNLC